MNTRKYMHLKRIICVLILISIGIVGAKAQRLIRGHVYGARTTTDPVDSMQISTYRGVVTFSDATGFYQISSENPNKDTLYVSYKGRRIMAYPISMITTPEKFDIYLQNPAFYDDSYFNQLEDVKVNARNYHTDSLEKRRIYGDIFDYTKPKFSPLHPVSSAINVFRQPYLNRQKRYQEFAVSSEQDGYIDSRFTPTLVASLTGIEDDVELHTFMKKYRPSYDQLKGMVDLSLGQYIIDCYKVFKVQGARQPLMSADSSKTDQDHK